MNKILLVFNLIHFLKLSGIYTYVLYVLFFL
jgi:hypothetical protein